MRITVLFDAAGVIIAAVPADPGYDGPTPAAADGCEVLEVDVPEHLAEQPLHEICTTMRVDRERRALTEAAD